MQELTPLEQIYPLLTEWQDLEIQRMILAGKQRSIESRMRMMLGQQTDPFGIHAGLDLASSIDEQKRKAAARLGKGPGQQY